MQKSLIIAGAALLSAACSSTQQASPTAISSAHNIPTKSGEIVIASAQERQGLYDAWHYAPAVRAENLIVFSGVPVASVTGAKPMDDAGLEASIRYAFKSLERTLKAANASFEDVIELRTYHIFDSDYYDGGKDEQMRAFIKVKDEFMKGPYPAWTLIGVSDLFMDEAVLEIAITAVAPEE